MSETKRRFMDGTLHPANVLMCPHTCVTNLPKPREVHPDVGECFALWLKRSRIRILLLKKSALPVHDRDALRSLHLLFNDLRSYYLITLEPNVLVFFASAPIYSSLKLFYDTGSNLSGLDSS